ncbi:CHRD domain-containing protein [Rhodococcus sp. D2-41]|uniref:CHRD domain-containing protein n=1 Tax=Speluncibacter jeojiensis TaxID=2710754 RepID=UPI002410880E|nr:CHRD domain-containing protein [Rhodococcus sp. D2-41]MDG3009856.1 CHRD domain-containing protein [Rhodococcus sp. D2-41]
MTAAAALTLAGCSSASNPPSGTSAAPPPKTIGLAAMPVGTATLSWDPNTQDIAVALAMHGFTPSSSHAMHIHPGTCADQRTPPSVPLPDLVADAGGSVQQTVHSEPAPEGIPANSYLNVHLAPAATLGPPGGVGMTSLACADIPAGTSPHGPVTLKLHPSGTAPTGTATLAYDKAAHTLKVTVVAQGLRPDTAHAVHLHQGTCDAQGSVVHPLPELTAGADGSAHATITLDDITSPPPATGWYVNVHLGSSDQITHDGAPTELFAPILCGDVNG